MDASPEPTPAWSGIRLLVVDDHPILREGIAAVVTAEPDIRVVAQAGDGHEAIAAFEQHRPDVTLMDLQMPELGGVEAIAAIRARWPDARILVLTTYKGDVQAARALQAGACGVLLKEMIRNGIVGAVRAAHAGERDIGTEGAAGPRALPLSAREVDVLREVARGGHNRAIGLRLGISEDTVKAHMKSIMAKLGAKDRTHAVTIALQRGVMEL